MPAPPPTVPLAFETHGPPAGRPVVLLHGFPFDRSMWNETSQALVAAGYRSILVDLRGHGKSPVTPEMTVEAMARDVAELLERENIRGAAVVGFSMGGYVALQMAIRHLDVTRALVLVDTRAEADSSEARNGRREAAADVKARGMVALVERMMPKLTAKPSALAAGNGPGGAPLSPVEERLKAMMMAAPPEGAIAALGALAARPDVRGKLQFLRLPSLVLVGEQDAVTPLESAHVLSQGLAGELEVVKGAGHAMPLEKPAEFHRVLLAWLSGNLPAR
jgi:pimeloyl-ACP methyl ester carboxylesterase